MRNSTVAPTLAALYNEEADISSMIRCLAPGYPPTEPKRQELLAQQVLMWAEIAKLEGKPPYPPKPKLP